MSQPYGYRPTVDVEPGTPPREPAGASSASRLPSVQGRCPLCDGSSLFLGDGGYVTCSRADCPEPDAASTLLERDPRAAQPSDAYRNEIRHEAAEEQRAAIAEIMERWGGYLHQDMLTELIEVIDPRGRP